VQYFSLILSLYVKKKSKFNISYIIYIVINTVSILFYHKKKVYVKAIINFFFLSVFVNIMMYSVLLHILLRQNNFHLFRFLYEQIYHVIKNNIIQYYIAYYLKTVFVFYSYWPRLHIKIVTWFLLDYPSIGAVYTSL